VLASALALSALCWVAHTSHALPGDPPPPKKPVAERAPEAYHLFKPNGQFADDYDEILAKLKAGDILVFENGSRFVVLDPKLGHGNTTQIISVRPAKKSKTPIRAEKAALRVPVSKEAWARQFINKTQRGYRKLFKSKVPIVELLDHFDNQYALMEQVDVWFGFTDFLADHPIDLENPDRTTREFIEFVRKTAVFDRIGDFHSAQIVYTREKGWTILDWSDSTRSIYELDGGAALGTAFSTMKEDLIKEVLATRDPFKKEQFEKMLKNWEKIESSVNSQIEIARKSLVKDDFALEELDLDSLPKLEEHTPGSRKATKKPGETISTGSAVKQPVKRNCDLKSKLPRIDLNAIVPEEIILKNMDDLTTQ
jgi:hypothetical protein